MGVRPVGLCCALATPRRMRACGGGGEGSGGSGRRWGGGNGGVERAKVGRSRRNGERRRWASFAWDRAARCRQRWQLYATTSQKHAGKSEGGSYRMGDLTGM